MLNSYFLTRFISKRIIISQSMTYTITSYYCLSHGPLLWLVVCFSRMKIALLWMKADQISPRCYLTLNFCFLTFRSCFRSFPEGRGRGTALPASVSCPVFPRILSDVSQLQSTEFTYVAL